MTLVNSVQVDRMRACELIDAMKFLVKGFQWNPYQHSFLEVVLSGLEIAWIWPFCLGYPCLSHLHLKAVRQILTAAETIVRDMPVPSSCSVRLLSYVALSQNPGRRQKAEGSCCMCHCILHKL